MSMPDLGIRNECEIQQVTMVYLRNAPGRKGSHRKQQLKAKEKENEVQAALEGIDWAYSLFPTYQILVVTS